MLTWLLRLCALCLLLAPRLAAATAVRADLAEALRSWEDTTPEGLPGPGSSIHLDLQVPRDMGCVRTPDPSTGMTLRCATDPGLGSAPALIYQQREVDRGLRPILFMDLGSALSQRLRAHLEQRYEQVSLDRGPIPVTARLKYDIHGGRFGERDMRVVLQAEIEGQIVEARGHSRQRLPAGHMAWYLPTVPLFGTGLVLMDRIDREAVAAQALFTLDQAAGRLAEQLSELALDGRAAPRPIRRPEPAPSPDPEPVEPAREPAPPPEPEPEEPAVALVEQPEPPPVVKPPRLPSAPSRCRSTAPRELSSLVQEALLGFATQDAPGFEAAAGQAARALPCVDQPLAPSQAAAFHRLVGLRAWYAGDQEAARVAFHAARILQPGFRLSGKVAPPEGDLYALLSELPRVAATHSDPLGAPAGADAWLDGVLGAERPRDLPVVLQLGPGDGTVVWTGYLPPGVAVPGHRRRSLLASVPYAFIRTGQVGSEPERFGRPAPKAPPTPQLHQQDQGREVTTAEDAPRQRPDPVSEPAPDPGPELAPTLDPRPGPDLTLDPPAATARGETGLVVAAIATGAVAAGLYGTAHVTRWRFDHQGPTRGLLIATNSCMASSIGLGVVSVTFTTLALTRRRR